MLEEKGFDRSPGRGIYYQTSGNFYSTKLMQLGGDRGRGGRGGFDRGGGRGGGRGINI